MKRLSAFLFAALIYSYSIAQSFVNTSLENWASPSVCETNLPPDGWSNYSNVGLGPDEANFSLCSTTIPPAAADGHIYARCLAGNPNTGEGMYQTVSGFAVGEMYTIIYKYCGSNRWGGSGDCWWHLFLDDVDMNQSPVFSSGDSIWKTNYYIFTATAVSHKIGFRAYTPTYNGGGSAAIDNLAIIRGEFTGQQELNLSSVSVYPNPFHSSASLQLNSNAYDKLQIFNVLGEPVHMQWINSSSSVINREGLANGIYFYRITGKEVKTLTGKLIIE